jgi:hypothetical protein
MDVVNDMRKALGMPAATTTPSSGLNTDLADRLEEAKAEYRRVYGKDMPITSTVRTRAEQEALFNTRGTNPNLVAPPGKSQHEVGNAVDVAANVPDTFLNRFGLHRPHGAKDPVHVELMPVSQPSSTVADMRQSLGIPQVGNVPAAEAPGATVEGMRDQMQAPAPREEVNFQNLQTGQPTVQRMFEPKTPAQQAAQQLIESVPGSRQLGEFGNVAAGTISKSVSAVQELVGKYFPGLSDEQRNAIVASATKGAKEAESVIKPIEETSPKTALAGEVTGFLANPINKLIPAGKPAESLIGAIGKSGFQGMVGNILTTPVADETKSFDTEKIKQGLIGFTGGGVAGASFHALGGALAKGIDFVKAKYGNAIHPSQLNEAADNVILQAGIDRSKVPVEFFNSLKDQARNALQTGDVKSFQQFAQNYSQANGLPVPVPMLRGQLTRDPMQYAVEQNLRGIQGTGEPIQALLQKQNSALIQNLDAFGAKIGDDVTTSGHTLKNALRKADQAEQQVVKDAYTAYKNSTGKNIDVPLQGLAQDYARVLKDFGADQIPHGVRNNLDALGLIKGGQLKVTTIDDAENLIKVINRNYDPAKQPKGTINALDDLRNSLNNAIREAGANLPGQAGAAAREARSTAEKRFKAIEGMPALRDLMKGKEPDKFVQNHILNGNVDEISRMTKYLETNNPEALNQVRNDVMRFIKQRVVGNVSDENARFSQAQLKAFLSDASEQRLKRFLSPEQITGLKQLNKVAENALVEPVSAAVNRSNTASAAANLIQGTVKSGMVNELLTNVASIKFPGVAWGARALQDVNQRSRASDLIQQAVNPAAAPATTPIRNLIERPGLAGAAAADQAIRQRNLEYERQNQ